MPPKQPIVTEEVTEEIIDAPNTPNPRDQRMADIAAKNYARETGTSPDHAVEASTHPDVQAAHNENLAPAPEIEEDNTQLPEAVTTAPTAVPDGLPIHMQDGVPMVTLKVHGETMEMPFDKVVGTAQKNLAAENRLRKAHDLEQELNQRKELLDRREVQINTSRPPPPARDAERSRVVNPPTEQAKSFVDTLFDGSREEATQQMARLMASQPQTPSVNPVVLQRQAAEQAKKATLDVLKERDAKAAEDRLNSDLQAGLQAVQAKYPEVLDDDALFSLVDRRSEDVAKQNPDMPVQEIMMESARFIHERMVAPEQTPEPVPSSPTRQERKARLKPVPDSRAGSRIAPPQDDGELDMSPKAVIARMRADRDGTANRM